MAFHRVKSEQDYRTFIENENYNIRNKLKNSIINEQLGEKSAYESFEKLHKPIVKAIEKAQLQSPVSVKDESMLSDEVVDKTVLLSQFIFKKIRSGSAQARPTTLELNEGTGKIGKTGYIDIVTLFNKDIILFTYGNTTEELPATEGLLYLLFAPYKYIESNESAQSAITLKDAELYTGILSKAGVDETVKGTSKKFTKFIVPVIMNTPTTTGLTPGKLKQQKEGKGLKLSTETGELGKIRIDYPALMTGQCKVYKDGQLIINERVDEDFIYLMTKRYNPRKRYSPQSVEMYKRVIELSEQAPTQYSGKLKLMRQPCSKLYWNNFDELVKRLQLLIAARESGNISIANMNEITEILDLLLQNGIISSDEHRSISLLCTKQI